MKNIVDRMKNLSNFLVRDMFLQIQFRLFLSLRNMIHLTCVTIPTCVCVCQVIEANLNGEMNLKIETDLVSVTTHFKDLGNPPWGENCLFVTAPVFISHTHSTEISQWFRFWFYLSPSTPLCFPSR